MLKKRYGDDQDKINQIKAKIGKSVDYPLTFSDPKFIKLLEKENAGLKIGLATESDEGQEVGDKERGLLTKGVYLETFDVKDKDGNTVSLLSLKILGRITFDLKDLLSEEDRKDIESDPEFVEGVYTKFCVKTDFGLGTLYTAEEADKAIMTGNAFVTMHLEAMDPRNPNHHERHFHIHELSKSPFISISLQISELKGSVFVPVSPKRMWEFEKLGLPLPTHLVANMHLPGLSAENYWRTHGDTVLKVAWVAEKAMKEAASGKERPPLQVEYGTFLNAAGKKRKLYLDNSPGSIQESYLREIFKRLQKTSDIPANDIIKDVSTEASNQETSDDSKVSLNVTDYCKWLDKNISATAAHLTDIHTDIFPSPGWKNCILGFNLQRIPKLGNLILKYMKAKDRGAICRAGYEIREFVKRGGDSVLERKISELGALEDDLQKIDKGSKAEIEKKEGEIGTARKELNKIVPRELFDVLEHVNLGIERIETTNNELDEMYKQMDNILHAYASLKETNQSQFMQLEGIRQHMIEVKTQVEKYRIMIPKFYEFGTGKRDIKKAIDSLKGGVDAWEESLGYTADFVKEKENAEEETIAEEKEEAAAADSAPDVNEENKTEEKEESDTEEVSRASSEDDIKQKKEIENAAKKREFDDSDVDD